jgi:hypothetical protein
MTAEPSNLHESGSTVSNPEVNDTYTDGMLIAKVNQFSFYKFCGPNYSREFPQCGSNLFSRKLIFTVQNQPLYKNSLEKTIIKHCKISCP